MGTPDRLRARLATPEKIRASRPALYILCVVLSAVAGFAYRFRADSIFSCQASGYSADNYLGYCDGGSYGDFEHGAVQFDLEPSIRTSAADADVLFLGNSRLQIGFSTQATAKWFAAAGDRYYLMGFNSFENVIFTQALLRRIRPQAKAYVINVDDFFVAAESPPARAVLHDPTARRRYEVKQLWQQAHAALCKAMPRLCGNSFATYRSRSTGAYVIEGALTAKPGLVSYDPAVDVDVVQSSVAIGREFLAHDAAGKCVILTMVPFGQTKIGDAGAIAEGLGLPLIAPRVAGELGMFDGIHLEAPSAERWSEAFFAAAGPAIRSCLVRQAAAVQ